MSLKIFFAKTLSTSDNSIDQSLRPHYYLNDYKTIKNQVLTIAKQNNLEVKSIDDRFQEILLVKSGNCDIVMTIYRAGSSGTRIDLNVDIETAISFGKCKKTIEWVYAQLDSHLTRKGNVNA